METHGYMVDNKRGEAVDTCHGACGDGCPACGARAEINFRPVDTRMQWYMGGADPKLDPTPEAGDERFVRNAGADGIRR